MNLNWFTSLEELKDKARAGSEEYNNERPHSSLKMKTPKEFLEYYDKELNAV
ncbi:MAG: integrase core domain-containing protein [Bacteriovorax sp.]